MSGMEGKLSVQRIVVALDASPRSLEVIETATSLAARLSSEIMGLFVEDINLLRVADLPFTQEVSTFSSGRRSLDRPELERQFRAQAGWMRQALERAAESKHLPWKFRVVRGSVAGELLAAGAEAELLILGKIGRSLMQKRRIGSTVRMLILERSGLTLVLQEGRELATPVVVIYDGSPGSQKALAVAGGLVETNQTSLLVIALADDESSAPKLRGDLAEKLRDLGLIADIRLLINPSLEGLAEVVRMQSAGPVVIPCGPRLLQNEALCSLVNEIPNPVLILR
ncbi:MAG: universal stress protein [Deltaproteobacteria bacterium]|nr:universal stress protein [Deltaproteobacteria bacterium]